MILIFVQTLVFVNNIHERPLRSLPFVPTRSPSSKLRLALACLRRRSWPITCLRCPLVFIARSSILVAFTARKDYSLCEYRSSRIVCHDSARSPDFCQHGRQILLRISKLDCGMTHRSCASVSRTADDHMLFISDSHMTHFDISDDANYLV